MKDDMPLPHSYWIQTFSGRAFDLMLPRPDMFDIVDVAESLSRLCRFVGHVRCEHYSVAQHCVHVAEIVPAVEARAGLLHDVHEFVLGDAASPWLRLLRHHNVRIIDHFREQIDKAAALAFRLPFPIASPAVLRADLMMLAAEKRDLLAKEPQPWHASVPKLADISMLPPIKPWSQAHARNRFLELFDKLGGAL